MVDVNVSPFEIEVLTRHGDLVRADVYLPREASGPFPVLLVLSLPEDAAPSTGHDIGFPLHRIWAHAALPRRRIRLRRNGHPRCGPIGRDWDPVSRTEGEEDFLTT